MFRGVSRSDGNPPGMVVGIAPSVSVTASASRRDSSGERLALNKAIPARHLSRANCRAYAARLISAERAISAIRRSSCVALPVRASFFAVNAYELLRGQRIRLSAAAPGQPVASAALATSETVLIRAAMYVSSSAI